MKRIILTTLVLLAMALAPASAQAATASPAWAIQSLATPTNFAPGEPADSSQQPRYLVFITNNGAAATDRSPITITDTLPAGLTVKEVALLPPRGLNIADSGTPPTCQTAIDAGTEVSTVTCTVSEPTPPGKEPARLAPDDAYFLQVKVAVPPGASGTLTNRVEVEGGGAKPAAGESQNQASSENAKAGFEEFKAQTSDAAGQPVLAAASRPYELTTSFGVNLEPTPPNSSVSFVPAQGDLKQVEVALPPGLVGNPTAAKRCSAQDFNTLHESAAGVAIDCPASSMVGVVLIETLEGEGLLASAPIYNLVPPPGMPAQLGFQVLSTPNYIDTRLRSDGDYGITGYLESITEARRISAARVMLWGTPWEASHDAVRGGPVEGEGPERPFLRAPSSCVSPLTATMSFTTWARPLTGASASWLEPAPTECDRPPFDPTIEARPTTNVADAPSGLHVDVHIPQKENEDPEGLGEADLKDTTVTLPEGLSVNPSSADGLGACSLSEVGYQGEKEGRQTFSAAPAQCPDSSKLGTVQIKSPLVDHPLPGAVYLAMPHENPFNSLLAIYITVNDPETGVVVKLAGKVSPDPKTGQLTTTVEQSPQLPFEDFELDFFEGARAPLRTPATCGTHTTTATFTPWSAPEGSNAFPTSSFDTTTPAAGQGSCPTSAASLPSSSSFEAGTITPTAGAFSPLIINLSRGDGTQEFGKLTLKPPPGLLAKLAGIPYCSEAALASASTKSGRSEQAGPSCPSASQVGTATVGAGAGPAPYHVTGKVYLAGPYEGAPLSLAVITPAVAGPFDLGTVVVRTALHVDPATTQITAVTDPIPHILQGIPLDVRSISVRLDHSGWGLNPTSCEPFSFDGSLQSVLGGSASLQNHFQVGDCAKLGFKPKLQLSLKGKTKRTGFPALHAVFTPRAGDANLKSLVLRFPRSEFIEQGHFRTICTRVQWAAGGGEGEQCPKGSVYGKIKATTPLLDNPLEGLVYLRSSDHNLPDVVFALKGQVDAEVAVRIDSQKGGLRASIENAPDVPITKVTLDMQGGQKGLFVNSRDICAHAYKASATLGAQSGRGLQLKPQMQAQCGGRGESKRKGHAHRESHRGR